MKRLVEVFIVFIVIMNVNPVFSQDQPLQEDDPLSELKDAEAAIEEEMRWLQAETFVITASRVLENIKKSAASITVITERQIRRMGARHLMDVLRTVPGMSYRYSGLGIYRLDARGVSKDSGQDILLMINSHPLNNSFLGGALWEHDCLIVDNIERIEVIRGPGSAMYGANAFSGVINIITKTPEEIDGYRITTRGGSYDTQQYNFLFGKSWNDIGIALNFNYLNTDGFEPYIEQDTQTTLDQGFGPFIPGYVNTSLAPGNAASGEEKYDVSLTLEYKGLKFDGRYVEREIVPNVNPNYSLNKNGKSGYDNYYLNLSYERSLTEGLEIFGKTYRNHNYVNQYSQGYPDAPVFTPIGIAVLSEEGFIAEPSVKNDRTGVEIQATYRTGDVNTVVAGITYEKMKQYDVRYSANFLYSSDTPMAQDLTVIIPLYSVQDLTDIQNYNQNAVRTFKAFFIQDIWDIRHDLRLTVGARYDDYSDFGDSFNPRAGITWEFAKGYNLKLLYGRAFRAPSFYELYNQNNPAVLGNPDLKSEKVDTYEFSLGAEFKGFSGRVTGFRNTIKDNISLIKDIESQGSIFQNKEKLRSQGFEAELKYDFGKGTYLAMNYTWQDTENLDTKERLWDVPEHKGNVMANIRLSRYFNFYTDLCFQDGYKREAEDHREEHSGFGIVNATLIAKKFLKGFEIRGSVYNLFDKEYTYPSPVDTLPVDYPVPGRNFIIELQYEF